MMRCELLIITVETKRIVEAVLDAAPPSGLASFQLRFWAVRETTSPPHDTSYLDAVIDRVFV